MQVSQAIITGCAAALLVVAGAAQDRPPRPGNGVVAPVLVKEVKPRYTAEAKAQRIQGSVFLDVVVRRDGTVGDVTVTTSLDKTHGLDEQAVEAVRQWEFKPGRRDGKPLDVLVEIEITFSLR